MIVLVYLYNNAYDFYQYMIRYIRHLLVCQLHTIIFINYFTYGILPDILNFLLLTQFYITGLNIYYQQNHLCLCKYYFILQDLHSNASIYFVYILNNSFKWKHNYYSN